MNGCFTPIISMVFAPRAYVAISAFSFGDTGFPAVISSSERNELGTSFILPWCAGRNIEPLRRLKDSRHRITWTPLGVFTGGSLMLPISPTIFPGLTCDLISAYCLISPAPSFFDAYRANMVSFGLNITSISWVPPGFLRVDPPNSSPFPVCIFCWKYVRSCGCCFNVCMSVNSGDGCRVAGSCFNISCRAREVDRKISCCNDVIFLATSCFWRNDSYPFWPP